MGNKNQFSEDFRNAKSNKSIPKDKRKVIGHSSTEDWLNAFDDELSMMGYRDDSPYRDRSSIDIHTPTGMIDMSQTGIPLMANGQYLPPYSGMHNMGTPYVKETPVKKYGGWLDNLPKAQDGLFNTLYAKLNPYNWGVEDYSKEKNFNKAYSSAKKAGQEEFMFNGKRFNTKYAGTPRQEVGAYGVNGKPILSQDINQPIELYKYPAMSFKHMGHIAADNMGNVVDYGPAGNYKNNTLESLNTYNVYGADKNIFNKKSKSLPIHLDPLKATIGDNTNKGNWTLATNNCADNICDAFDIPRSKGIQLPSGALSKIKEKYPTLDVTGRTYSDYYNLSEKLQGLSPEKILPQAKNILGIASSPDLRDLSPRFISIIQDALNKSGYSLPNSIKKDKSFDGVLGSETISALQNWQSKNKKAYGGPIYQGGGPFIIRDQEGNASYEPQSDTIYLSKDRGDKDMIHELYHRQQALAGRLRIPEYDPYGLARKAPAIMEEEAQVDYPYFNRRRIDEEELTNQFLMDNPSFQFADPEAVYNYQVNPDMYGSFWTAEGEARAAESPEGREYLRSEEIGPDYLVPDKKLGGWLDKYQYAGPTKENAKAQALANLSKPFLSPNVVQSVLKKSDETIKDSKGTIISTPQSREIQNRQKYLAEHPDKYDISDYTKHGIKEPGSQLEGLSDPLNWPAYMAMGEPIAAGMGVLGEAAYPYVSKIMGALETPATIAGKQIPWLTGNNLMAGYFGSKIPEDIQQGNYFDATLNALPFVTPIAESAYSIGKGFLPKFSKSVTPSVEASVTSTLPNLTESVAPWSMQELPGLHLESTMDSPLNKFIKPIEKPLNKEGLISTEQALNLVKSREGKERYEIVMRGFKEKFGDGIPKKMTEDDFVNFANASFVDEKGMMYVDDILKIIGKESGGADKVALIKQGLGENIPKKMDFNDFRKTVQDQLIPLERQFSEEHSNYGIDRLGYNDGTLVTKEVDGKIVHTLEPSYIENQTLILGNKNKFGKGSNAHGNPDETLGHAHFLRDAETPDVLTVTQIQSDAFQGTHRIMPKVFDKDAQLRSLSKMERIAARQEELAKTAKQIDATTWQLSDGSLVDKSVFENLGKGQSKMNAMKKAEIENFTQKSLLDKNHQERYIQELVDYAGKRGDINKIRVPTSETAAKVQGYSPSEGIGNDLARFKRELEAAQKAIKNAPQNELIQRQANIEHYKKQIEELSKIQHKPIYSPEHQTILKKYSEQPKTIKKLFGEEPKVVTDSKGNTWYEFDIPENFKGTKGEIKAFKQGGSTGWLSKYE